MLTLSKPLYFVSAIDTGVGKTYITGKLAKMLCNKGVRVITQKLAQTGCKGVAEDIIEHRKWMQVELLPEDISHTTCRYVFEYPASPHLAAALENCVINDSLILQDTKKLLENYDVCLLEGAGGLMVPLNNTLLTIDFIAKNNMPLILVTSPRLGSINHTLLSLEACLTRQILVDAVIFNNFPYTEATLANESKRFIANWLKLNSPQTQFLEMD